MKNFIPISIFLLFTTISSWAFEPVHPLVSINAQWNLHQEELNKVGIVTFDDDVDLIQQHLLWVHHFLSIKDISNLSQVQKENRANGLAHLYAYAKRSQFPINTFTLNRHPVFIDSYGTHCAVGQLITDSGDPQLSRRISKEFNLSYLKDISSSELLAWQKQSGFTLQELAWIQPGYLNPVNFKSLKGGVNGQVNNIISDNNGGLFVGGHFDTADGQKVGNMANYFSGFAGFDWMAFGGQGLNGEVYDMIEYKGELYVGGIFYMADTVYTGSGVVKWNGTTWEAVGDFYVGALVNFVVDLEIYRDTLYAGGFFRANSMAAKHFESIAKWNGTEWVHAGVDLYGGVSKLHVHDGKLVVGGQYILTDSAGTQNICMLDSNGVQLFAKDLDLKVNDITTYNGELVIATPFTHVSSPDTLGVAVYRNNNWEALYNGGNTVNQSTGEIKSLASYNQYLFFGGDFSIAPLVGYHGKNIAYLNSGVVETFGILDSTVNCLSVQNDMMYIGGEFVGAGPIAGYDSVNHICSVYLPDHLSNTPSIKVNKVSVYPNPARTTVLIEGYKGAGDYRVISSAGQEVMAGKLSIGGQELKVESLANGQYIIELRYEGIKTSKKLMIY